MNLLPVRSAFFTQVLLTHLVVLLVLAASLSEGAGGAGSLSRGAGRNRNSNNRNGTAVGDESRGEASGGGGGERRKGGRGKGNGDRSRVRQRNGERPRRHRHSDLSMWIDEKQVKLFSGYPMVIHIITDGYVLPYLLDPNFEKHLPVIPAEVGVVNFTWRAGDKKYYYNFDRLQSYNEEVLLPPIVSVDTKGRIPRRPKVFSVQLPCSGKSSGIASFTVGLLIETRKGKPLAGTPMRLRLRKECSVKGPGPEFCPEGYMGPNCKTALCYPQCMNGGVCTAPGVCDCKPGYNGLHCEGGICADKCLNGGKCIQKDTCECPSGYYGLRCEYSKCMIPCLNGGKCKGVNLCKCSPSYSGDHCEVGHSNRTLSQRHTCALPCRHGECVAPNKCECHEGWYGRRCQRAIFVR